jgi:hypothetical protein
MKTPCCLCLLLAGIGWCYGPPVAAAQGPESGTPRRPYVPIPFEGDLDRTLAERLLDVRGMEQIKALLDSAGLDPELLGMTDLDVNQSRDRDTIRKIIEKLKGKIDDKQTEALSRMLERKEDSEPHGGPAENREDQPPVAKPVQPAAPAPPPEKDAPPPVEQLELETLPEWTRELLKEAERWEWDDTVKKSPALQEGFKDLQRLLAQSEGARPHFPSEGLARWTAALASSGGRNPALPDLSWANFKGLSLPSLPRLNLHLPRVGSWGRVPKLALGLPRLGMPGGNGRALGQGALWIGGAALAILVCWQGLRHRSGMRVRRAGGPWQPGPWPVNPATIATRAELIQAFEYLSMLRLGPNARSWNHRAIAAQLGEPEGASGTSRQAADDLASLYERARYAPLADSLPTDALASARRDLCLLAGMANA